MAHDSITSAQERGARRLQQSLHHVLAGVALGSMIETIFDDTTCEGGLGDIDHATMVLIEETPSMIAGLASLLDEVRAGLRDARVRRFPQAWARLTSCQRQLAVLTGREMPDIPHWPSYLSPHERRFRTVIAPEPYSPALMDGPVVFVAGGITSCPDWQADVTAALADDHVVVLNPRRPSFDLTDPDATVEQVQWEYDHRTHDALAYMLFWFPAADSHQPIAMLELGDALARTDLPIIVGADPHFPRYRDVVLQCRAARPSLTVHADLGDVVTEMQQLLRWPSTMLDTK
jgi:hypothetical protein